MTRFQNRRKIDHKANIRVSSRFSFRYQMKERSSGVSVWTRGGQKRRRRCQLPTPALFSPILCIKVPKARSGQLDSFGQPGVGNCPPLPSSQTAPLKERQRASGQTYWKSKINPIKLRRVRNKCVTNFW